MNCKDMMQIPELTEVLKLKAGENGLQKSVRWIYFADCLQCVKSEYRIENYIHGGEFVVLTNPSVTDDSRKLVLEEKDRNAAEQLFSSILDAEHLSRERVMAQARYLNLAPLTMTDRQMEKGLEIFEDSLKEALEA
ncbi:PucR family transcriptional regulator ligand-binding domain-containing protein [Blautia massiliensis (ex Durand et al. 2017)]|uniref:PucR family transcriptional regulator ligand-binding domain-containing protein n=1 Tax=Blautia massiliensis (ex Durand et al. 2017) TaxID=1737424 RepID=UPI0022E8FF49|nr:PucR family transcriptional regulator ligand-binding domain-containing protein [Blautia massiliensis (ex Durand et al. 2017)]